MEKYGIGIGIIQEKNVDQSENGTQIIGIGPQAKTIWPKHL